MVESRYIATRSDLGDQARDATAGGSQPTVVKFHLGIDHSKAATEIDNGSCKTAANYYYPKETMNPKVRPGLVPWSDAALPGKITAGCIYEKNSTTSFIVVACEDDFSNPTTQELHYFESDGTSHEIEDDLGSLVPPTFKVFNGRLLIAVEGQYIREWDGTEEANPAVTAEQAEIVFTFNFESGPAEVKPGDWIVIGDRTFTFWAERTLPGEVAIPSPYDDSDQAANLVAAILEDSYDITAENTAGEVTVTAKRYGTIGNDYPFTCSFTDGDNYLTDGPGVDGLFNDSAGYSAGVDGVALSVIDGREAPKTGIIAGDRWGRVISFGDETNSNRLGFSRPGNEWDWASGSYGEGESIDIGAQEGNMPSALVPFHDEIWAHKIGQNREIYRIRIADSSPETWDVRYKPFEDMNASLNPRCAMSLTDKQIVLDRGFFGKYMFSEVGDEITPNMAGLKVHDLLAGTVQGEAFMAKNPSDLYVLIFRSYSNECLCYHYGSERWTTWKFAGPLRIGWAEYYEAEEAMFFGCNDGYIYVEDPTVSSDNGIQFQPVIVGKTFRSSSMKRIDLLQTTIDYEPSIEGSGYFAVILDGVDSPGNKLFDFTIDIPDVRIADAEGVIDSWDDIGFSVSGQLGHETDYTQANGRLVAPKVVLTSGAITLDSVTMRLAPFGRD